MMAYIFFSLIVPSLLFLPVLYLGAKPLGEYTARKGINSIDAGLIGSAVGGIVIFLLVVASSVVYGLYTG
jgi:hypothetical protein